MTNARRITLVAVLVLVSTLAPTLAVGAAGASPGTQPAQLAIDQPSYIQESVTTSTGGNGSTVYHVRGAPIEITPTNFQAEDVVSYGVETQGGQLTYQSEFNEFAFTADQTGTYTVYWTVEYQATVNQTVNGTTTMETVTRQQRYEAHLRVEGGLDMTHLQAGSLEETRQQAANWEEFNATVQDLRGATLWSNLGLSDRMSTEETIQAMINAYRLQNSPIAALSGNTMQIVMMLVITLGGLLILTFGLGYHTTIIAILYGALNRHEANESAEGELSDRILDAEYRENLSALANKDFADVWSDDHIAAAMRELGANPKDAYLNYRSLFQPRNIIHDRLAVMSQNGYVAVVDDATQPDGGDDASQEIVDAHVARTENVPEDAETHTLAVPSPEHSLLDALDWSQPLIREFDFLNADYDPSEGPATEYDSVDLADLVERTNLDQRQFEDEADAAQYVREFLADIRQHEFTDDHGTPDTLRFTVNEFLDTAHVLHDRFQLPVQFDVDLWERALIDHDPREQARSLQEDVREGYYD